MFSCERVENSLKRLSLENRFEETFLFQLADNSQIKDLRDSRIFRQRLARADFVDKLLKAFGLGLEILGIKFVGDEVVSSVQYVGLVGLHVASKSFDAFLAVAFKASDAFDKGFDECLGGRRLFAQKSRRYDGSQVRIIQAHLSQHGIALLGESEA